MSIDVTEVATASGALPRRLSDDVLWGGGCLPVPYKSKLLHGHFGVYVVKFDGGAYLVDTGYPVMAEEMERQLDEFLGDTPVDYIFPTHPEIPHAGLLGRWLEKYPNAVVIGDTRDFHLYYPEQMASGSFRHFAAGEALDLGDRVLTFVPAVWRDLPSSMWMHDSATGILFVSDAFAFLHPHEDGECDRLASEQETPDLETAQFFNNAALFWTRFGDVEGTFPDIDELLTRLKPTMIAPAHGAVCDNVEELVPFFKRSMTS
ncbi:MBL fold metallo-hydrolase [Saccharomonospora sp. NPDC046836]|uniref:MBL fold metallo-hydrolase n=1 Tax=Saccharomonospora sp. NPDC046836 TaxID=3156921 RepID=UPI0033D07E6F